MGFWSCDVLDAFAVSVLTVPNWALGETWLSCVLQYMVVYQLMLTLCSTSAYFMDGSGFSYEQVTCSPPAMSLPCLRMPLARSACSD